ncbi:hypothetical protein Trydic_g14170 [Trypoxylus dichotomus]
MHRDSVRIPACITKVENQVAKIEFRNPARETQIAMISHNFLEQFGIVFNKASGFHQIELEPESRPKTALNVENGHFEFVRMPFVLKNAPATFQRVMDNVLNGLQGPSNITVRNVFERLRDAGLKIQLGKSEFSISQ